MSLFQYRVCTKGPLTLNFPNTYERRICKTCESYAFIRREILSTQHFPCGSPSEPVKAFPGVFGEYTKLVYNDLDVFEKLPILRVIF